MSLESFFTSFPIIFCQEREKSQEFYFFTFPDSIVYPAVGLNKGSRPKKLIFLADMSTMGRGRGAKKRKSYVFLFYFSFQKTHIGIHEKKLRFFLDGSLESGL